MADWLNNSLSQVVSPSLSSKSAANTLRSSYLREEAVSTRKLTIATTLDASEVCDNRRGTLDFTTVFSRARSKCYLVRCLLFSDTFKHGEIQARCLSSFQASGNRCRNFFKKKAETRFRECAGSQMERKTICPNKETFTTSSKRKLVMFFQENAQLREDYLKRRLNWTEENEECKMLILLLMKLACNSNLREWNSIGRIN